MKNLTLLEQEALGILKQLERCCEVVELHNPEYVSEKKFLEVTFGDLDFSVLKKGENIHDIEKYLQKNGLNFKITFDLINDIPDMYIDREHPDESFIEIGVIRGENIQDIKTKIKELIDKLNSKKPVPIVKKILAEEDKPSDTIFPLSENGIGYLIFYGEKIPIGEISTSKFKLLETLCAMGLGKGKTINTVFDYIKVGKDKNKTDNRLNSTYLAKNRKLELINGQMREVNRAITKYAKDNKIKNLKYRLRLKTENDTIWMENKVGRHG